MEICAICGRKNILILILYLTLSNLFAQNTQTLRGSITDKDNQTALIGATIALLDTDKGTISDADGRFRLDELAVGRYQIQVSYVGYENLILPEILLEAGKETVLNIELQETASSLQAVEITTPRRYNRNDVPLSMHSLTIEETRRFPANFNDPVRLAVSLPGVSQNNDQANGISIRGHSPSNMGWRLEGVDIVNPNHLSNAGTFSDLPAVSGGGVNILSAQLLNNTNFIKGAAPVGMGNALSGTMDMQLRKGNEEQREHTLEFGLLGIDVATEGPFSKKSKASYLVNYRYSFTGILGALGVSFGGEAISFQDLAVNLNFPLKKGNLNVFALGGSSRNEFTTTRDSTLWEFEKDDKDILYTNEMIATGLHLDVALSKKLRLDATGVFSRLVTYRQTNFAPFDDQHASIYEDTDLIEYYKAGGKIELKYKLNPRHRLRLGTNVGEHFFNSLGGIGTAYHGRRKGEILLVQPFFNWQFQKGAFSTNVGVQYSFFALYDSNIGAPVNNYTLNDSENDGVVEPRISFKWDFKPKQFIALAYGLHSQMQQPQTYIPSAVDAIYLQNQNLGLSKAHHLTLGYTNYLSNTTTFSLEAYYQHLFDIPIVNEPNRTFSTLNLVETWQNEVLENAGTGTNYGIEASLQRHITNGLYYLINATYYRSLYVAGDGVERSTRFDGKYIGNATFGKEWSKNKKGKDKTWGANARLTYLGGYRDTPIDIAASAENGRTIYDESQAFSLRQKDYFKLDVRFYYRKNKGKRSSTIALDLQNATNQENVAFSYFDTRKGEVIVKNQLGLIPNLSYRMQF